MSDDKPTRPGGEDEGQRLWQLLHQDDGEAQTRVPQPKPPAKPAETVSGVAPQPWQRQSARSSQSAADVDQAEAPEGVSRIERILFDPEHADAIVEAAKPRIEDVDYDEAVLNFHRETGIAVACKTHPDANAVDQCPVCQAYYCQACMVVRRGRLLCRDCATSLFVPSEHDVLRAAELGLGEPVPEVTEEEKPEFQVGSTMLGLEGWPAHPVKRVFALLIDLLITRAMVLLLALFAGIFFGQQPGAFFHLFDQMGSDPAASNVFRAMVLMRPVIPWVVVFAVMDFSYFFFTMSFFNRTVGMGWLSCRIVTEWGDFAGFSTVALRTLVMMICLGAPAILLAWFFPAYRGPHDYAAGTLVINYAGVKRIDSYETVQIKLK
jgi:uncharacterized RDD family membrane protein YckC